MSDFVHLHVKSEFSIGESAASREEIFAKAKELGMSACAITDHNLLFNIDEIIETAQKYDIKPILGIEIDFAPNNKEISRLTLLAKNKTGYENLKKISSLLCSGMSINEKTLEMCKEGIICIGGDEFKKIILSDRKFENWRNILNQRLLWHKRVFGNDFYCEITRYDANNKKEQFVNDILINLIPNKIVATNNAAFANKDDVEKYRIMSTLFNKEFASDEAWLKSSKEMGDIFKDIEYAVKNTTIIANHCENPVNWSKNEICFTSGDNDIQILRDILIKNIKKYDIKPDVFDIYMERIDKELQIIKQCNFAKRLLIISDIIEYAKQNDIPLGFGRGSCCESFVCFCLGITNVNPLVWKGLLLERFIHQDRVSFPDIDIDICAERRMECIQYIKEKYGAEAMAYIPVVERYKPRKAVQNIIKAFLNANHANDESKKLSELLKKNENSTISEMFKKGLFKNFNPYIIDCLKKAELIEGLPCLFKLHPSGIVLSDQNIASLSSLMTMKNKGNGFCQVIQKEGKYIEKDPSLFKIDMLASRMATIVHYTLKNIASSNKNSPSIQDMLKYGRISLKEVFKESDVYNLYCDNNEHNSCFNGIFQMGDYGTKVAQIIQPNKFSELTAWMALTRPGAGDQITIGNYARNKKNRNLITYYGLKDILKPVLEETNGIIIYQEQVMEIAKRVANYSAAEADDLQHAISKKHAGKIKSHKPRFINGAVANNIKQSDAEKLFSIVERFAGYGFNKAHAIAYAYSSFCTAWLKYNYPLEFALAVIEHGDTEKNSWCNINKCVEWIKNQDCLAEFDLMTSNKDSEIINGKVQIGFSSISGITEKAINDLLKLRSVWQDDIPCNLADFMSRSPNFDKSFLLALNNCGALDSWIEGGHNRELVNRNIDRIYLEAQEIRKNPNKEKINHFLGVIPEKFVLNINGENVFKNIPEHLFTSENRIKISQINEYQELSQNNNELYFMAAISKLQKMDDGKISGIIEDESGAIKIDNINIQKITETYHKEYSAYQDNMAMETDPLSEGRHIKYNEPKNIMNNPHGNNAAQIYLRLEHNQNNELNIIIDNAKIPQNDAVYTVMRLPDNYNSCKAEKELDIIENKYRCSNSDNVDFYYVTYADDNISKCMRPLVLRKCAESENEMSKWHEKFCEIKQTQNCAISN